MICSKCGDEYSSSSVGGDTSGLCRSCLGCPLPYVLHYGYCCPYCKKRNNDATIMGPRMCGVIQCRRCSKDFFIEPSGAYDTYGILACELEKDKARYGYDGINGKLEPMEKP